MATPKPLRSAGMVSDPDKQHQCTSEAQLEPVYAALGEIDLDPASNPNSIVRARHKIFHWEAGWHGPFRPGCVLGDGLKAQWGAQRVFLQPNFDKLGPWMGKLAEELFAEVVVFVPARTHRNWFWQMWRANVLCFPGASGFHGEKHSAPFAMVYGYFGCNGDRVEQAWRQGGFGHVLRRTKKTPPGMGGA